MPALFWLIVAVLAIGTAVAVAAPTTGWTRSVDGSGGRPDATGARTAPPWLGTAVMLLVSIVASLVLSMLVPGLGALILLLPLAIIGRRRRPRGGPPSP